MPSCLGHPANGMKRMKLTIYRKLLMFTLPVVCVSILGVGYYSYFDGQRRDYERDPVESG